MTLMALSPEETALESEWHRLRSLLRYAILCGTVAIHGDGYGMPPGGSYGGIDTERELDYVDLLRALRLQRSRDPFGHMLLVRNVGMHCGDRKCRGGPGHWHKTSWADLLGRHKLAALKERERASMAFVVEATAPRLR